MSWVIILLELLPTAIKIIGIIRQLIELMRVSERKAARRELAAICRRHVRQRRNQKAVYGLRSSEDVVMEELEALRAKLEAQQAAA